MWEDDTGPLPRIVPTPHDHWHGGVSSRTPAGRLASDAGRLVVREFDERIRLTRQFAAALNDRRLQPTHSLLAMVRQRVSGILAAWNPSAARLTQGRGNMGLQRAAQGLAVDTYRLELLGVDLDA